MDIRKFLKRKCMSDSSEDTAGNLIAGSSNIINDNSNQTSSNYDEDLSSKVQDVLETSPLDKSKREKPLIPENAYQPNVQIIPSQILNNRSLHFQEKWFKDFPWLHYDIDIEATLCFICIVALDKKLTDLSKKPDEAFIIRGFKNWKKAIEKFKYHEKSDFHRLASTNLAHQKQQQSISSQLNMQVSSEQMLAQNALLKIISTLAFLAKQGLAIRGHEINGGNFLELLELRATDDPNLKKWLSKTTNYTSPEIQNEILLLMSNRLLRGIICEIKVESNIFGIIVDGTQDINGKEQECLCIRYINKSFSIEEKFIGLCEINSTTGASLCETIKDVLIRYGLPIANLRSQTYDGASNMSGQYKGCQAEVKKLQPLALYVHCGAHVTHLVLSKAVEESTVIKNALDNVQQLGTLYKQSGKFKQLYLNLNISDTIIDSPSNLKPICPTRWLTRAKSVRIVIQNYKSVLEATETCADEFGTQTATCANGLNSCFRKSGTLLGLQMSIPVIEILEHFNVSLQCSTNTVSGMLKGATIVSNQLQELRTESKFSEIFNKTIAEARELDLEPLTTVPRCCSMSEEQYLRAEYYKLIDNAQINLKKYFTSTDIDKYGKLTDALLKDKPDFEALSKYPELSDSHSLKLQLEFFKNNYKVKKISDYHKIFCNMSDDLRSMFPLVENLMRLILISPASSCSAQRSFSALRRLKGYLRSTMTQRRLNNVMMCNIHKDSLGEVKTEIIANEFIGNSTNPRRLHTFGRIQNTS